MHFSTRCADLRQFALIVVLACVTSTTLAKGGGVGYWLEGTISNVRVAEGRVELVIAGRLTLDQYTGGPSTRQAIHYECERGISASLVQWESFFAMSTDWRAGGLRGGGELARLAQAALEHGNVIKLELVKPQIDFVDWQCPIVKAEVIRATDPNLK